MYWLFILFLFVLQVSTSLARIEVDCAHKNATLFYSGYHRDIELVRHVDSQTEPFQHLPTIYTQSLVTSMTYDTTHREILFVETSNLRQIKGVHRTVQTHVVIDQKEFEFSAIAFDEVAGNVYFVDESKGIGVCNGHANGSQCTLLIKLTNDRLYGKQTELLVHSRRGLLFWLQREQVNSSSIVKMAGLDGNHIRQLSTSEPINTIYLDDQTDSLYIAYELQIARIDLVTFAKEWIAYDYVTKFVYWNCNLYFLGWKHSNGFALRYYGQKRYKVIKEQVALTSSMLLLPDEEQVAIDSNPCEQFDCSGICVLTEASPNLQAKCIQSPASKSAKQEDQKVINAYNMFSFMLFLAASKSDNLKKDVVTNLNHPILIHVLIVFVIFELVIIGLLFTFTTLRSRIKCLFGNCTVELCN